MKIATTTADFESYVEKRTQVCEMLAMLADCGFKHIDLNMYKSVFPGSPMCGDEWEKWVDDIGNTAARLGQDFVQAHSSDTYYAEGPDKDYQTSMIKRELEICAKLGIPGMVVHGVNTKDGKRDDFMKVNTALYLDLLQTAEKTGVAVYTENTTHRNSQTYYLYTGEDMNEMCDRVGNHPLFGVCWDVGHAHADNLNQYDEIMTMGANLKAVHVHDNLGTDVHLQMYSGNCAYDPLVKGLVDVGYKGTFTLEAYSLPSPKGFLGRKGLEKDGVVYDTLTSLPISLKIRSELLMHDIARYMLETYDCYED
ncbi:MAG: sugar phosphate isomerase/epimerase [Ruminococcaceae bacterium]|nr:sugar phosphate isomerase/epimerase [Oscillospiraceae bacterium]